MQTNRQSDLIEKAELCRKTLENLRRQNDWQGQKGEGNFVRGVGEGHSGKRDTNSLEIVAQSLEKEGTDGFNGDPAV